MIWLLACLLVLQETETIPRNHRDAYQRALLHYEKAVEKMETEPKNALSEIEQVFELKAVEKKDRHILIERVLPGATPRGYDFFPNHVRGRIRLNLSRSDPDNAATLLTGAIADLKASVDAGVKASEDPLRNARAALDRLKAVKPPDPPKDNAEQSFRDAWLKLVDDHRYKSARDLVETKGGALSADRRRDLLRDTDQRSAKHVSAVLEEFLKAMDLYPRPPMLRQLKGADFARLFTLPSETETVGASPELDWSRKERALLEKLRLSDFRARQEDATALLGALVAQMIAAEPLEKTTDNRWFHASAQLALRYAEEQVQGLAAAARDATPDQRRQQRERAEKLRGLWADGLASLPKDFVERNPIREGPRKLGTIFEEFPVDIDEVDRVDLEACLTGDSPDSALEHVISDLTRIRKEQGARLSKESTRKLLTELIAATALHDLLAGKAVDDVIKSVEEPGHLLAQAGGPVDAAKWGPKVQRVFAALH